MNWIFTYLFLTVLIGFGVNEKLTPGIFANAYFAAHQSFNCPKETERNRYFVKQFFLNNHLEVRRAELGIGHLTVDDIQILSNPEDDTVCQQLYLNHQQAIEYVSAPDEKKLREVVFYKAGQYYFVIVQFRLPDNPNQIIYGVQGITIYDQNLNRLVGISY